MSLKLKQRGNRDGLTYFKGDFMVKNRVMSYFLEVKFMNIGLCPFRKSSGRVCSKLSREIVGLAATFSFLLHVLL